MRLAQATLCFFVIASQLACSHVVREINKQWPPKTTCDDQIAGLQATKAALGTIQSATFYAGVSGPRLDDVTQAALTRHQIPLIQKVAVTTGVQEIVFDVQFAGRFDALPTVYAAGSAYVHVVPTLEQNHLVLRPTFDRIKLRRVKYKKEEVPGDVVKLLNSVLTTYVNNLNGAIQPQQLMFGTNVVGDIDPTSIVANDKLAGNVHGAPLHVNVQLARSALLVDPAGIHVVGELQENVQSTAPQSITAAATDATAATGVKCDKAVDDLFKNIVKPAFLAAAAPLGNESALQWNSTSASVQTEFVRTVMNDIGQKLFFGVTYNIPPTQAKFGPSTITTDPAPNLNCSNIQADEHQQDCEHIPYNCYERGCDSDCAWYDAGCLARKAACEATKAAERAGCETRHGAEVAGCLAWNVLDKARAAAETATKKLACAANQEWLNAWQNTPIGDIGGYFALHDTHATVDISHIAVAKDFRTVSMATGLRGDSGVSASINFQPKDLGYIVCQAPWSAGIESSVVVRPTDNAPFSADIRHYRDTSKALVIAADIPGREFQAEFSESPVLSLLFQNPQVIVACMPGTYLGLTAQLTGSVINVLKPGTAPDLLQRTFKFSTNQLSLPMTLPPLDVSNPEVPTVTLRLFPQWDPNVLRYTE